MYDPNEYQMVRGLLAANQIQPQQPMARNAYGASPAQGAMQSYQPQQSNADAYRAAQQAAFVGSAPTQPQYQPGTSPDVPEGFGRPMQRMTPAPIQSQASTGLKDMYGRPVPQSGVNQQTLRGTMSPSQQRMGLAGAQSYQNNNNSMIQAQLKGFGVQGRAPAQMGTTSTPSGTYSNTTGQPVPQKPSAQSVMGSSGIATGAMAGVRR